MSDRLSNENDLQKNAFELYYKLGEKRSLKAVAETVGRTERTIAGWSSSFNWVSRVIQRSIEEAKNKSDERVNTQLTDVRTRYRIMINNFMAGLSKDIAQGKIKVKSVSDYEKLVKLDMLLMGEATDRIEACGEQGFSKEAEDKLLEIYNSIKKLKS